MNLVVLAALLLAPLAWSGLVAALRAMFAGGRPDDALEKRILAAQLAPLAFGLVALLVGRVAPISVAWTPPTAAFGALVAVNAGAPAAAAGAHPGISAQALPWTSWLITACLALYAAVALARAGALLFAFTKLARIAATARPADIAGASVRVTKADIPPVAYGRKTIILPAYVIAEWSEADLRFIIAHEREHLRRRDGLYYALLSWADALVWFNPFVRRQTARCRAAAEIACDAGVLKGAAWPQREAYAAALVRALKHAALAKRTPAPAILYTSRVKEHRMRLHMIMRAAAETPRVKRRWLYALLGLAAAPLAVVQLAWSQPAAPAPTAHIFYYRAPGDGVVSDIREEPGWAPGYSGKFYGLTIDHGGGVTTHYTFESMPRRLKVGDHIAAGQVIAPEGADQSASSETPDADIDLSRCAEDPRPCPNSSGYGRDFGNIGISANDPRLWVGGRLVRADFIAYDIEHKRAFAHGHVLITAEAPPAMVDAPTPQH